MEISNISNIKDFTSNFSNEMFLIASARNSKKLMIDGIPIKLFNKKEKNMKLEQTATFCSKTEEFSISNFIDDEKKKEIFAQMDILAEVNLDELKKSFLNVT